ncbi:MAG: hypothetical protein ACLQNE_43965, partial [Thermoguttaceae bacterium]
MAEALVERAEQSRPARHQHQYVAARFERAVDAAQDGGGVLGILLHALRNRFLRTPNVVVQRLDPAAPQDLAALADRFDTVLCLNVLEYA